VIRLRICAYQVIAITRLMVPSMKAILTVTYQPPYSLVPPTQEVTRASALVGYEGNELTPAISAFLRPNDAERLTAEHLGLARHTQIADVTINAELTYSQSGGVRAPADPPQPDELPFGAIWQASLITFQLAPEANGVIDGAFCDWEGLGYYWESGRIFRDLTRCIRKGRQETCLLTGRFGPGWHG
jgi:hypothetical protein